MAPLDSETEELIERAGRGDALARRELLLHTAFGRIRVEIFTWPRS
jgi:hypothetical protein